MITIDTINYNLPFTAIRRKADILFKDGAGRTSDGTLHAEPIGTYYNYDVEIGQSVRNRVDYRLLWKKITEPVSSHSIIVPDEDGPYTFDCYFAGINDELVRWKGIETYFRRLNFSIIAISPARTP